MAVKGSAGVSPAASGDPPDAKISAFDSAKLRLRHAPGFDSIRAEISV